MFLAGLGFLFLTFLPSLHGATVTWVGGSGDWNTATNWSTASLPGTNDDVVIGVGASITVTHSSGTHTVNSVQSQQAFVLSGGSLTVSNTFLASNTFTLSGGTLATATVVMTNGISLVVSSGTLNGVAVNGVLDVGNTYSGASLTVINGLVLNGTALVGHPSNGNYGRIYFAGTQPLNGSGTVVFGLGLSCGATTRNAFIVSDAGTELTIGPGIIVRGQNGVIGYSPCYDWPQNVVVLNQGTISADVSGGTIYVNAQPFTNQGVIQSPAGTLNLAGTLTTGGLGNFQSGSGPLALSGVLTNTGTMLVLNGVTNTLTLQGGTVLGGSVTMTGGAFLVVNSGSGTLDGVTVNGMLDVGNSYSGASLTVLDGLTMNGTLLVGHPSNGNYGRIYFAGTQALNGSGTVVFGLGLSCGAITRNGLLVSDADTGLTIGPGITVRGQNGVIGYSPCYGGPQNVVVLNQGTISADVSGGTITVNAQPFTSTGALQALAGAVLNASVSLSLNDLT